MSSMLSFCKLPMPEVTGFPPLGFRPSLRPPVTGAEHGDGSPAEHCSVRDWILPAGVVSAEDRCRLTRL